MRRTALWALCGMTLLAFSGCGHKKEFPGVGPDVALNRLLEGNRRYVEAKMVHPDQTRERRAGVASAQSPFAVILGCADSRVPPEILFDQGLGDLFVVRVAGDVVDDATLGSLEYAADHLGVRLILVLGHERCGAVQAALKAEEAEGHVEYLLKALKPAIEAARGKPGDPLDNAVRANVSLVASTLKKSKPVLRELVEEGRLKVVGARYDLDTGAVAITDP